MRSPSSRTSLAALLALVAVLIIAVSACGHGSGSGASGSPARAIPASAIAYVQADIDSSSPAWTAFDKVSHRFPGWGQIVAKVHSELLARDHGVSFSNDVEPALGSDAAFAVTGIDTGTGKPAWVGYVALTDESKIESALVTDQGKAAGTYNGYKQYQSTDGTHEYAAVGDNALLIASDENTLHTAIDTRNGDDPSLAADATFQQAMAALPADSILKAFVDPGKISRLLSLGSFGQSLGGTATGGATAELSQLSKTLSSIKSAGFAVWAVPDGYRATVQVATVPGASSSIAQSLQQNPTLGTLVPAGSFLYLDGFGSQQTFGQTFSQPSTKAQLQELQQVTGISFAHDVLPLLTGEIAAYAGPGQSGTPGFALLLKPADPAAAQAALTNLIHRITELEGGSAQTAAFLRWAHRDGVFAIGSDLSAVQGTSNTPLPGSPAWNALLSAAGAPGDARISLYVQVPQLLALFPIEQNENLTHVGGILAWSTVAGDQVSGNLFVQVK